MVDPYLQNYQRIALSHKQLLIAEGPERTAFLQSQLCGTVATTDATKLNAALNRHGRVLYLLWTIEKAERTFLFFHDDAAAPLLALRSMIFRRNLSLEPADENTQVIGLVPCPSASATEAIKYQAQASKDHSIQDHSIHWLSCGRGLVIHPDSDSLSPELLSLPQGDFGDWVRHSIMHGVPHLSRDLAGKMLPFSLNLDLLGALSLNKGCYPGQEIASRMFFRSRIKHRMVHLCAASDPTHGQQAAYESMYNSSQMVCREGIVPIQPICRFPLSAGAEPQSSTRDWCALVAMPVQEIDASKAFFADSAMNAALKVEHLAPTQTF